ncbi:ABC transporter permease [Nocardioides lijunqiniae]|uniref:ABC transporter permease n=1 Tax=Nocardioides lijunqiniae TaxID=2760832 RepID=UPI001D0C547D|nr:ABC transporter permease [Nocardioides lijunqiniae]
MTDMERPGDATDPTSPVALAGPGETMSGAPVTPTFALSKADRGGGGGRLAFNIGVTLVLLWVVIAITIPWWTPFDPVTDQDLQGRLAGPGGEHWFGTDNLGRDVFARVMYGARLSLPIALVTVAVSVAIGCLIGAVAGFLGGIADEVIMRISDIVLSFPAIVLALAIAAALGPSTTNVVISIAAVTWPEYTRLMRGQVLSIRNNLHVLAAQSIGCSRARVFRVHVLPFGLQPILVKATVDLGMVILLAAGLSFIGVGAVPPTPEWGAMVSEAQSRIDSWWLGLFPGLAILSMVLAFNFIGDAMRDRFDPQMRTQRGKGGGAMSRILRRTFLGRAGERAA